MAIEAGTFPEQGVHWDRNFLAAIFRDPDADDETLRQAYSQVERGPRLTFLLSGKDAPLRSLYRSLIKDGFHFKPSILDVFVEKIEGVQEPPIPIGRTKRYTVQTGIHKGEVQRYSFIASAQEDRIDRVAHGIPELAEYLQNPVQLYLGPKDSVLPTTTAIKKSGAYISLSETLQTVGIRFNTNDLLSVAERYLPSDCSVPIFTLRQSRVNGNVCYQVAAELADNLRAMIKAKILE